MKILCQDFKTMNIALVDRFLSLMEETYTKDFTDMRITNPDIQFCEWLAYFVDKYRETNESERATNNTRMKTSWSLQDGFEKMQLRIEDGNIYAMFAGQPISNSEVVNIDISVIGQTGMFGDKYEQWHEWADDSKTWNDFKTFWKAKIKLKIKTTINAGQFGFGGNAQQVDQEVTNSQFEASMKNFIDSHKSTLSIVSNLTDTNSCLTSSIPQLHQQMQMMQLIMQQQINNTEQNNWGNNGGKNNNADNRGKKKKSSRGNSWNGGGNSNSGVNIWNSGNSF